MAMIEDPAGAMLALWQAKGHPGAAVVGETGSMCWNELIVHDVPRARAFYEGLFGWSSQVSDMPSGPYTVFRLGEVPVAGLMAIAPEWGDAPPSWGVYVAVDDCDAAVARATAAGGALVAGPMEVPGVGRFAILADPAKAVFAVMRFAGRG
jgi:predicted enzyme related to lactoylglutathione lyase